MVIIVMIIFGLQTLVVSMSAWRIAKVQMGVSRMPTAQLETFVVFIVVVLILTDPEIQVTCVML